MTGSKHKRHNKCIIKIFQVVICNDTRSQTTNCTRPELVAKNLTATIIAKTVGIRMPEEVSSISTTVTNIIENIAFNDIEKAKEVRKYLI